MITGLAIGALAATVTVLALIVYTQRADQRDTKQLAEYQAALQQAQTILSRYGLMVVALTLKAGGDRHAVKVPAALLERAASWQVEQSIRPDGGVDLHATPSPPKG